MTSRPAFAWRVALFELIASMSLLATVVAAAPPLVDVPGQPLAANVRRVLDALELCGRKPPDALLMSLGESLSEEDARAIQEQLDPHVACVVTINPESRVKVERGPADSILQQAGHVPLLVKIVNQGTVRARLSITSPQAGADYDGVAPLSMERMDQQSLTSAPPAKGGIRRFLNVEMFRQSPLTDQLSGLAAEYAIALIYSSDSGQREATLSFNVAQGTQDLGFRGDVPILFEIRPAVPVILSILDDDGSPAFAKLTIRDRAGHVYPPQMRRLAPDLFFQKHIYRKSGETVWLPPGEFDVEYSRGPEYRVLSAKWTVVETEMPPPVSLQLERWVSPMKYGFYNGDHHIHGAGCAHYSSPTEGVTPQDMYRQVAGEGLNVGCILTWGPCFEFQRRFFDPGVNEISEPLTLLKYDLEISGFGSAPLGHVCLLNLKDQTYPGSEGTKERGWPTWTTPTLRWAKGQGAVTGFAHSGSGLRIDPPAAARRLLAQYDSDRSRQLSVAEAVRALLPATFTSMDSNKDQFLSEPEIHTALDKAADRIPNLAIPEMDSVGAMELPVAVAMEVCDFISAMDTPRMAEWNMWYHVMNCGFPLKVSGETDFPCMSSQSAGQGRVYVQLGKVSQLDFTAWCGALATGRSYVSDGYAHALKFEVGGHVPGEAHHIDGPQMVSVTARVAFAPATPESVAYGTRAAEGGARWTGDTVTLHGERSEKLIQGGERLVELVVNGQVVDTKTVVADGLEHDVGFATRVELSSWVALRHFPQLHTNPVQVLVAGQPIRASRSSARWCEEAILQLWRVRQNNIAAHERAEASRTFDKALEIYRQRGREAPEGT